MTGTLVSPFPRPFSVYVMMYSVRTPLCGSAGSCHRIKIHVDAIKVCKLRGAFCGAGEAKKYRIGKIKTKENVYRRGGMLKAIHMQCAHKLCVRKLENLYMCCAMTL